MTNLTSATGTVTNLTSTTGTITNLTSTTGTIANLTVTDTANINDAGLGGTNSLTMDGTDGALNLDNAGMSNLNFGATGGSITGSAGANVSALGALPN